MSTNEDKENIANNVKKIAKSVFASTKCVANSLFIVIYAKI